MTYLHLGQRAKNTGLKRTRNPPITLHIFLDTLRRLNGAQPLSAKHDFLDLTKSCVTELPSQRLGHATQLLPLVAQQPRFTSQTGRVGTRKPISNVLRCPVQLSLAFSIGFQYAQA